MPYLLIRYIKLYIKSARSYTMTTISKKSAEEISNLMKTIICNDNFCNYLVSDSFKEKQDPNDSSTYWKLKYEWADAIIRLDDKFGIQHPLLEYVLENICFLEDQKFRERQENKRKYLEATAA
tara:strand:+ start:599 stop:967 length:369 start_codon:yes stop_codon:yes gene_type:complete